LLATACTSSEIRIAVEGENGPDGTVPKLTLGRGLVVRVDLFQLTQVANDDPEVDGYPSDQGTFTLDNATATPCAEGFCLIPGAGDRVTIRVETPDGSSEITREVTGDLRLSAFTISDESPAVDAIQLPANASTVIQLVARDGGGIRVSGHAPSYVGTGGITITGRTITTTTTGDATIAPAAPAGGSPLAVRVTTPDASAATVAKLAIDPFLAGDRPDSGSLVVHANDATSFFFVDGFDADGYLSLPGTPIAASGPNLAPAGYHGEACAIRGYCFANASLPAGPTSADTYVDLAAGTATQRVPVHIDR
jgi:hypothetical protein